MAKRRHRNTRHARQLRSWSCAGMASAVARHCNLAPTVASVPVPAGWQLPVERADPAARSDTTRQVERTRQVTEAWRGTTRCRWRRPRAQGRRRSERRLRLCHLGAQAVDRVDRPRPQCRCPTSPAPKVKSKPTRTCTTSSSSLRYALSTPSALKYWVRFVVKACAFLEPWRRPRETLRAAVGSDAVPAGHPQPNSGTSRARRQSPCGWASTAATPPLPQY